MNEPVKEKMVSVKMSGGEWWVVGLGGSKHGPQKSDFFFFLNWWDVTTETLTCSRDKTADGDPLICME